MENEFTPIESQEAFDTAIKARLERQKAKHAEEINSLTEQLNSYKETVGNAENTAKELEALKASLAEAQAKSEEYEQSIKDRDAKIADYETKNLKTSVAIEAGLPLELAERLTGTTKEELLDDAKTFLKAFGNKRNTAPMANPEVNAQAQDGVLARFKELNPNIKF